MPFHFLKKCGIISPGVKLIDPRTIGFILNKLFVMECMEKMNDLENVLLKQRDSKRNKSISRPETVATQASTQSDTTRHTPFQGSDDAGVTKRTEIEVDHTDAPGSLLSTMYVDVIGIGALSYETIAMMTDFHEKKRRLDELNESMTWLM